MTSAIAGPRDLPGLDPAWSRWVEAPDADGVVRRWHVLDTHAAADVAAAGEVPTLLCVHGNPTWSYLWRHIVAAAPDGWRVIAVDQLGMGYSEPAAGTLGRPRRYAQRIADLDALTDALRLSGPVVVAGHDWGGPIGLGWALRHPGQLAGLVLANTAINLGVSDKFSWLIRLARHPMVLRWCCVNTPVFVRGAAALSRRGLLRPGISTEIRDAYAAPYADPPSRSSVGQYLADVPLPTDHPTRPRVEEVAEQVRSLRVPALLLRGARDPVFTEGHLADLADRLPQADVQRYEDASHLVVEDRPDSAGHVWQWIGDVVEPALENGAGLAEDVGPAGDVEPAVPWRRLSERAGDTQTAIVEGDTGRRISFAELERDIETVARGLLAHGVVPGQRVAMLIPPGIDLTVVVYACWRLGAVIVVADAGLGLRSLARALRGARPDVIIGIPAALIAARALRIPGRRIVVSPSGKVRDRLVAAEATLAGVRASGAGDDTDLARVRADGLDDPDPECAVLFTSGATGPSKGVVYRLSQIAGQVEVLRDVLHIGDDDRFVAAFAPFALYAPAMGAPTAVPDMDVTAPGTLTATALAAAVENLGATVVFASPAALRNVVATAGKLSEDHRIALSRVRHVMSAGAPISVQLLRGVHTVVPHAELHTPYGMTEALPITDVTWAEIERAGPGNGVCVGRPHPTTRVLISPLPASIDGEDGELTDAAGVTGEICVSAPHLKDRYDRLWATERASLISPGWLRTGDVGHLDDEGRLWVEGRRVHVVHTAAGPVTPVGIEQRVEEIPGVAQAAVCGVGPVGTAQVVVVLVLEGQAPPTGKPLASPALTAAVRAAASVPVSAVLVVPQLPLDIRHQSKIDRTAVSRWADRVLAGKRPGALVRPRVGRRRR